MSIPGMIKDVPVIQAIMPAEGWWGLFDWGRDIPDEEPLVGWALLRWKDGDTEVRPLTNDTMNGLGAIWDDDSLLGVVHDTALSNMRPHYQKELQNRRKFETERAEAARG